MLFNIHILKVKQVFLFDGIGALLSALLLWVIYYFGEVFGVPTEMFTQLIIYPLVFALYSLTCAWIVPNKWKWFLWVIMICNLLYICYSWILVIYYFEEILLPGIIYFLSETLVVIAVVYFEYVAIRKNTALNRNIN